MWPQNLISLFPLLVPSLYHCYCHRNHCLTGINGTYPTEYRLEAIYWCAGHTLHVCASSTWQKTFFQSYVDCILAFAFFFSFPSLWVSSYLLFILYFISISQDHLEYNFCVYAGLSFKMSLEFLIQSLEPELIKQI